MYRLNISFANNVYTMKLGNWSSGSVTAAEVLPLPPRCDCDQNENLSECESAGGQMNISFPNISWPSMNPSPLPSGSAYQGYFAMSPPVSRSMRGTRFYDFTRTTYLGNGFYNVNTHDFSPIFNNPAPYFTGNYIGPNCIDITSTGMNFNTYSGAVTWRMDRYRWAGSLT